MEVKKVDSGETNVLLIMTKWKGGEVKMEVASRKKDLLSTDQKIRRNNTCFLDDSGLHRYSES